MHCQITPATGQALGRSDCPDLFHYGLPVRRHARMRRHGTDVFIAGGPVPVRCWTGFTSEDQKVIYGDCRTAGAHQTLFCPVPL